MTKNPDRERLKELYLPPTGDFSFVDVPEMPFAMIDGEGDPDGIEYTAAVKWLFSAIFPMRKLGKERMGKSFVEPPLECLYWADCMDDLIAGNRDKLKWRAMIVTPDWPDAAELLREGAAGAEKKLGEVPGRLRIESFDEGRCVQIMHVGDYRAAASSLAKRLHEEFLPANDLTAHGHHHEIYLTMPNRVAPEKMKTVMRQPVR